MCNVSSVYVYVVYNDIFLGNIIFVLFQLYILTHVYTYILTDSGSYEYNWYEDDQ